MAVLIDGTFRALRDYIYEKSGIYIADAKKYLIENRLARIVQEKQLQNFEDYFNLIRFANNGNELTRLFDAITTNETFFFRESQQLELMINVLLPKLVARNNGRIRIWSAACSTGEEPYTLSMLIREKLQNHAHIEIQASDISPGALLSAQRGIYNSYSVRNVPATYLKKYFEGSVQSYILSSSIRKSVKFAEVNLMDDKKIRMMRGTDIILCRNVLIYFDLKAKQRAISNLYDALNRGGYLIIGTSESLHNVTRAFRPIVSDKVIIYQKL